MAVIEFIYISVRWNYIFLMKGHTNCTFLEYEYPFIIYSRSVPDINLVSRIQQDRVHLNFKVFFHRMYR